MTTTTMPIQSGDEPLDLADMRRRIRAIFIGSIGNLVEWYDFYAYAAFALYFAAAFFPNSDPVVQQLNAALLFAAGFLVRPLGGWLFGYLADHRGRVVTQRENYYFERRLRGSRPIPSLNWEGQTP